LQITSESQWRILMFPDGLSTETEKQILRLRKILHSAGRKNVVRKTST
jgi:hypothetical protein